MMDKKMSYTKARKLLDEIVDNLDNNKYEIDEIEGKIKEARELIDFCNEKLEILSDLRKSIEENRQRSKE